MLIFVDYEHADRYGTEGGDKIQAARTRITYRLEDLADQPCMLVRYDRIDRELIDRLGATALFISGQGTALSRYEPAALEPLAELVSASGLPVFGFCGGFQFIAQTLGVPVVPLDVAAVDVESELITIGPNGAPFEYGYHPVQLLGEHPVLDGLSAAPIFRHAHGLHVPELPDGFVNLASTDATAVQLAVNDDRRIVGTQFHPEYWTDDHPAGETLIANFMRWAGITDR